MSSFFKPQSSQGLHKGHKGNYIKIYNYFALNGLKLIFY